MPPRKQKQKQKQRQTQKQSLKVVVNLGEKRRRAPARRRAARPQREEPEIRQFAPIFHLPLPPQTNISSPPPPPPPPPAPAPIKATTTTSTQTRMNIQTRPVENIGEQMMQKEAPKELARDVETERPPVFETPVPEPPIVEEAAAVAETPAKVSKITKPNKDTIDDIMTAYGLSTEKAALDWYYMERATGKNSGQVKSMIDKKMKSEVAAGRLSSVKEKGGIRTIRTPSGMQRFGGRFESPPKEEEQSLAESVFATTK